MTKTKVIINMRDVYSGFWWVEPSENRLTNYTECRSRKRRMDRKKKISSSDAYTDKVMTEGVFSRLCKPAYTSNRPEGEHEQRAKVLRSYNTVKEMVPKWQSGV